ncbi:hypothetical protein F5Y10DRAFT_146051 [Nemania abortiva]|nr:hypothetical protein F5Y10DRAFT_146051 [Nemania abortiva]
MSTFLYPSMEAEIAKLRALLDEKDRKQKDTEALLDEKDRKQKDTEALLDESDRKRKDAEKRAENSRPQTLQTFLESCHALSLAIRVVTKRSLTTQGNTTNPTGRVYPQRIIPWDKYDTQQEGIWSRLSGDWPFCSGAIFPSAHALDYVASRIRPITSETGLRDFERDTVENAVEQLVDEVYKDEQLRVHLGIQGSVTFENHTNLEGAVDADSESTQNMANAKGTDVTTPAPKRPRPKAHRKGRRGPADQFCIYRKSDGQDVPVLAIEYKAPHKLTKDEVVVGLNKEIQPERDVINKDGKGFSFTSKRLAAAVITQLFSYMVDKGIQYGYVCTGETFIFLYIPSDPSAVYYSVCVPNTDVEDEDKDRLHRTAVAQVFAFVLQALRSPPPSLSWHDRAAGLNTWAVEVEDVLRNIPETERKPPKASPYKPQRWKSFTRSPIKTRSSCRSEKNPYPRHKDESEDEDPPPSPSVSRSLRSSTKAPASTGTAAKGARPGCGRGGTSDKAKQYAQKGAQTRIQDRPYCTQKCLLGLASGGPMDNGCPNFSAHRRQHISPSEFLRLVRAQLASDRGPDADTIPLYLAGSVGALFKIRLSSHGYTLVAKGVEEDHIPRLQHERKVYDKLRTIQGKYVPVCLGEVDLVLPYYYDGGVFVRLLFLGWAGRPLFDLPSQADKNAVIDAVCVAFKAVHHLRILHGDAEPRNILYSSGSSNVMIVDFERAKLLDCEPLGLIGSKKKRKYGTRQEKQGKTDFETELQFITQGVQRYIT